MRYYLKTFEEFLKIGAIRKQSPDKERAKSLVYESKEKLEFFNKIKEIMKIEKMSPNYVVEACYDILIELLRAKLLVDGYNSKSSHEAEVAYMRNLGFIEKDVDFMNELRYLRNRIKYYGIVFDIEYAEQVHSFMNKILPILNKLVADK
jgi:hypothetical protein